MALLQMINLTHSIPLHPSGQSHPLLPQVESAWHLYSVFRHAEQGVCATTRKDTASWPEPCGPLTQVLPQQVKWQMYLWCKDNLVIEN